MYQLLKQNQKVIICNSFSIHDGKEATICGIANNLPECLMYIIELSDNANEYSHIVMHADSLVVDDGIIDRDVEVFNMFNNIQKSDKFTVEDAYEAFKDVPVNAQ
jgi:hypothetical protein